MKKIRKLKKNNFEKKRKKRKKGKVSQKKGRRITINYYCNL